MKSEQEERNGTLFKISKPRLEYQVLLNILYENIRSEFIH